MGRLYETRRLLARMLFGRLTTGMAAARPTWLMLAVMRQANWVLMSGDEILAVTEAIRSVPHCHLLVFGVGHDSRYWTSCNRRGTTVFLENDMDWAARIAPEIAGGRIVEVRYAHRRSAWRTLLDAPDRLALGLPPEVTGVPWDVVLVDGPTGMLPEQHGRMQSIHAAVGLARPGGHVFVHDCDREVEREYCDRFLGPANFVRQVGILRHYRKPPGGT